MKLIEFVKSNKLNIFKTIITYVTFAGLGGVNTLVGSSLLDLQIWVQRSFEATSRLVQARSIGYIIGASTCSFTGKRFNDMFILTLSTLVAGVFLIIAPWFKKLEIVIACVALSGYGQGITDIYSNMLVMKVWKENVTNWLQVLHMMYGLGALGTPIITRPFLLPETEREDFVMIDNATSYYNSTIQGQMYTPDDVKVRYPFMIIGGILVASSIPYLIIYMKDQKFDPAHGDKDNDTPKEDTKGQDISLCKKSVAVIMAAILANFTFGSESAIGNLGTSFAVKADVKMDKKTAVLLSTVYWSMFSFFRLIFIPLTFIIRESRLFTVHLIIVIISTVVMVPHAAHNSLYTWISFTLLGIGFSPLFSISFASLNNYFGLSETMTSIIVMNGVLGETIHTAILSEFIDSRPIVFVYYMGALSIVYVVISFILPYYLEYIKRPEKS